jgi:hypothetical protein
LAKAVDKFVAANKAKGMTGFVVLIGESGKENREKLEELAKEKDISIPLTLAKPPGPGSYKLSAKAEVTALVTKFNKVKARFGFSGASSKEAVEKEAAQLQEAAQQVLK